MIKVFNRAYTLLPQRWCRIEMGPFIDNDGFRLGSFDLILVFQDFFDNSLVIVLVIFDFRFDCGLFGDRFLDRYLLSLLSEQVDRERRRETRMLGAAIIIVSGDWINKYRKTRTSASRAWYCRGTRMHHLSRSK
jgi:hypothetical protein